MRAAAGTAWLARRWLRRRAVAMIPLALLVAVGVAGTGLALTAARSSASAYRDHLERAGVGDVLVNPVINSADVDAVIRTLPGVDEVTTSVVLTASADDGSPRSRRTLLAESGGYAGNVTGSVDGRYTAMDRPVVHEGRLPVGQREVVVTRSVARQEGLGVGDVVTLSFWADNVTTGEEIPGYMDEVIAPLGTEELTVVGVVTPFDEVLPDDLYQRQRVLVSPDVVARYDCLPAVPPTGTTLEVLHEALLPPGCAVRYRYYSLSFADGPAGVAPALDALGRATAALNEELARTQLLEGQLVPVYVAGGLETATERARVEQAIRPTVTALLVLAGAAGAVTLALVSLAVARELRRTDADRRQWRQLGMVRSARAAVALVPVGLALVAGALVGIGVLWWVSPGPQGLVAVVRASSARALDGVVLLVLLALVAVASLVAAVLALRTTAAATLARASTGARPWRRARIGSPVVDDGVRAALRARTAAPALGGGVLLTATLSAALVFGASLGSLLATPAAFGWPWDASLMAGYGYFGLDLESAGAELDGDPAVAQWSALGFSGEVTVAGRPVPALVDYSPEPGGGFTLLAGTAPRGGREVALGARSARDLGAAVGDQVVLEGLFDPPLEVTVSGLAVLPSLGPFEAERTGPGTGLVMPFAALEHSRFDPAFAPLLVSFVGVDLHDDHDGAAPRDELRQRLRPFDRSGFPEVGHAGAVRPPEIVDARATRAIPVWVVAVFSAVTAAGATFVSWASVRARRRDLAVLRALGFRRRQVRASVVITSCTMMATVLAVGVPIGVLVGRVLWRSYAEQLGVLPEPAPPWAPVGAAVVGGLVLAVASSLLPARQATKPIPAAALRGE